MSLGRSLVARTPQEVVLTKEEHLQAVIEAQKELFDALQTEDAVLFAAGMRHARAKLAPLLGFEVADDVLARIFSQFCIGK
jgi:tRNA modification GTPase